MVFGCAMLVTLVPFVSQCADTESIACGRGSVVPSACQLWLYLLSSMAFMGLPWPMNSTGILCDGARLLPSDANADNVDIPEICASANMPPAFINDPLFMANLIYCKITCIYM